MFDLLRGWLRSEPTRFVGYGTAAVLQGVLYLATLAHVTVPGDVQSGLSVFATFVFTEVIRAIVSSPATVAQLKADATDPPQ